MEHKGKAVKLQEEKDKWQAVKLQISQLKKDQNDEKEIMEELMSQTPIDEDLSIMNIEIPLNDFSADDLLVPMSQVSLKDEEIRELKVENEKVKSELAKVTENKNRILQDKSQLQKKFNELKERNIGKVPLEGSKHIIWDTLCVEITNFRQYLNFIDDQSILINLANQRLELVNESMERKSPLAQLRMH